MANKKARRTLKSLAKYFNRIDGATWYEALPFIAAHDDLEVAEIMGCVFIHDSEGNLFIPPLITEEGITVEEALAHWFRTFGEFQVLFASEHLKPDLTGFFAQSELKGKPMLRIDPVDVNYINKVDDVIATEGKGYKKLRQNLRAFEKEWTPPAAIPTGFSFGWTSDMEILHEDSVILHDFVEKYSRDDLPYTDKEYNHNLIDLIGEDIGLFGSIYDVRGEPVAFNLGCWLADNTAAFLVSKNVRDIKFLVDFVRYDFHCQCKCLGFSFVNDGSDLDDEGMKRLKKKFAPEFKTKVVRWSIG